MRWVDGVLRRVRADAVFAGAVALIGCILLVEIGQATNASYDIFQLLQNEVSIFVRWMIASVIGGYGAVRIWRQLWRRGRDRWEVLVYGFGVRFVGASATLLLVMWCG